MKQGGHQNVTYKWLKRTVVIQSNGRLNTMWNLRFIKTEILLNLGFPAMLPTKKVFLLPTLIIQKIYILNWVISTRMESSPSIKNILHLTCILHVVKWQNDRTMHFKGRADVFFCLFFWFFFENTLGR